jgi:hypothetical protein
MIRDGFSHERWSVMDLHLGDGLLGDCLTLVECLFNILLVHWRSPNSLDDILHDGNTEMVACLENTVRRRSVW